MKATNEKESGKMYKNIGKKIKVLAQVVAWIGIIASVIAGICFIIVGANSYYDGGEMILAGFAVMIVGAFFSWISAFFTYGFGELVDNSAIIAGKQKADASEAYRAPVQETVDPKRQALDKMRREGLITEEEYNAKIAEL